MVVRLKNNLSTEGDFPVAKLKELLQGMKVDVSIEPDGLFMQKVTVEINIKGNLTRQEELDLACELGQSIGMLKIKKFIK